ncbi:MAG: pilus assembly protein TadG-related protein, partial [Anaerolineales bacterium]
MKVKINSNSERGQVLVIIAIAIIGLVGITGLAIDGSIILEDRRHAQNAADTAALAGALAKIQAQVPPPDGPGLSEIAARAPMKT